MSEGECILCGNSDSARPFTRIQRITGRYCGDACHALDLELIAAGKKKRARETQPPEPMRIDPRLLDYLAKTWSFHSFYRSTDPSIVALYADVAFRTRFAREHAADVANAIQKWMADRTNDADIAMWLPIIEQIGGLLNPQTVWIWASEKNERAIMQRYARLLQTLPHFDALVALHSAVKDNDDDRVRDILKEDAAVLFCVKTLGDLIKLQRASNAVQRWLLAHPETTEALIRGFRDEDVSAQLKATLATPSYTGKWTGDMRAFVKIWLRAALAQSKVNPLPLGFWPWIAAAGAGDVASTRMLVERYYMNPAYDGNFALDVARSQRTVAYRTFDMEDEADYTDVITYLESLGAVQAAEETRFKYTAPLKALYVSAGPFTYVVPDHPFYREIPL